jgi:hypothetical protein
MVKMTLLQMGNDDYICRPAADPATEEETKKTTTLARGVEESGQGLKRAVAEVVARPPGSNQVCTGTVDFSSR